MNSKPDHTKSKACIAEGWEVEGNTVWAYGKQFPLANPLAIHLKTYRTDESHQTRFDAMKRAFEILWPDQIITYNYWMERIFWEHTDHDTEIFTLAGGGGIGKTQTVSYVGALFFLALPHKRAVVVTSTTLASLKKRIYGFILRALEEAKPYLHLNLHVVNTPHPTISLPNPDFIHGIFGIAAKEGPDDKAIKDIIGHHPKNAMLLILDEAPDMPPAIMGAVPNLKKALEDRFQCIAIGNPDKLDDLHGALSTPEVGWDNIDPKKNFRWKTTQANGYCLYFNPYDSPAIHETDPIKKEALSKFLITEEKLIKAERDEGVDSVDFWRFTMGFWKNRSLSKTIVSEDFLKDYNPCHPAEFSGKYDLIVCAGLDPAFTAGGDKCILRLAVLGHHVNGKMVLDFRGEHFVFIIRIMANTGHSAEIQIADQVIAICKQYNVPLNTLCVDASGQGRGIADVIQLRAGGGLTPTKIYSTNIGNRNVQSFDVVISSGHDMWFKGREFISHGQIFGMDALAHGQLYSRWVIEKNGKKTLEPKPEYKKRMASIKSALGRSPDEADAAMLCIQSAVLHHGFFPGQVKEIKTYGNKADYAFEKAKEEYQARLKKEAEFKLRGNYGKGLGSLIGKKAF